LLPPLDDKALTYMREEMRGRGISWLIDLYLREVPNYLNNLKKALLATDGEKLYLAAHKFKGSSSNLGAQQVVALCKQLEISAHNNLFEQAAVQIAQLEEALEQLKVALEAEKQK